MSDIKTEAAKRAVRLLEASGVKYAVEIDGVIHGNLVVKQRKKRGEMLHYFWPIVQKAKPGDAIDISFDSFDGPTLASSISSACIRNWGTGSAMVRTDKARKCVELLRIA